jgi:hypothetical protein
LLKATLTTPWPMKLVKSISRAWSLALARPLLLFLHGGTAGHTEMKFSELCIHVFYCIMPTFCASFQSTFKMLMVMYSLLNCALASNHLVRCSSHDIGQNVHGRAVRAVAERRSTAGIRATLVLPGRDSLTSRGPSNRISILAKSLHRTNCRIRSPSSQAFASAFSLLISTFESFWC